MKSFLRSMLLPLGMLTCVCWSTGCSGGTIKITGKLMKNGSPMIVSEDTYVTVQFILASKKSDEESRSHTASFDQKTGTYTVLLPSGSYQTMVVMALPNRKDGKLSGPRPPIKSDKVHELTKDQVLDIEIPGN